MNFTAFFLEMWQQSSILYMVHRNWWGPKLFACWLPPYTSWIYFSNLLNCSLRTVYWTQINDVITNNVPWETGWIRLPFWWPCWVFTEKSWYLLIKNFTQVNYPNISHNSSMSNSIWHHTGLSSWFEWEHCFQLYPGRYNILKKSFLLCTSEEGFSVNKGSCIILCSLRLKLNGMVTAKEKPPFNIFL